MTDETAVDTATIDAAQPVDTTDGEQIDAKPEERIFVNLFKNTYEKNWKVLVSYKPGYVKKDDGKIGTYPVWFGMFHYETYTNKKWEEAKKTVYERVSWLTVEVNEKSPEKWDLRITLQDVDNKDYSTFFLHKWVNKKWDTIYKSDKPLEINGTRYRANLTKNKDVERPHLFLLTFSDAGGADYVSGTESEIIIDEPDF